MLQYNFVIWYYDINFFKKVENYSVCIIGKCYIVALHYVITLTRLNIFNKRGYYERY